MTKPKRNLVHQESNPSHLPEATIALADFVAHSRNYNGHSEAQITKLRTSLRKFGQVKNIVVWRNMFVAGHGLAQAAAAEGWQTLRANVIPDDWPEPRVLAYLAADNELARQSDPDQAALAALIDEVAQYDPELMQAIGYDEAEFAALLAEVAPKVAVKDVEPQIDKADELRKVWGVELGDLWQLGAHRLICGDCTDKATVERLMQGEKATLCHADPPYGMGKEKDGIANDNLYRNKLDEFQMLWWRTARPHLEDNASAYIWGNAEDLWRLWYVGGLKDSERLTLRNEIVWDKHDGQGMESDQHRMFPTATERALFFMLGEQGFNNNADNYWEGWEPIRGYLDGERIKLSWSKPDVERILGSVNKTQHIFSNSHFNLVTEVDYRKLQAAAKGDGFKREYDDIKREYDDIKREYDDIKQEFYATRAYFDNTHDNMTDVWQFGRVTGEDRHEHATPKPLEMVARAIKSSTPPDAIVYAPFNGTGPEVIACEQLSRQCRAIELDAGYVAITLQRFQDATGLQPERIT